MILASCYSFCHWAEFPWRMKVSLWQKGSESAAVRPKQDEATFPWSPSPGNAETTVESCGCYSWRQPACMSKSMCHFKVSAECVVSFSHYMFMTWPSYRQKGWKCSYRREGCQASDHSLRMSFNICNHWMYLQKSRDISSFPNPYQCCHEINTQNLT